MDDHLPRLSAENSSNNQQCLICGSPALGMNFGVLTCAPCKAFFRRNARRKELLESPCRHRHITLAMNENLYLRQRLSRYLQIRRCASCRLRRCFEVGMKEELVRTEAQNQRYRELVDLNRQRREIIKQQLYEIEQLSIPQMTRRRFTLTREGGDLSNKATNAQGFRSNDSINSEYTSSPHEYTYDRTLHDCIASVSFLKPFEWSHLSNVVASYDTNCVKQYIEKRSSIIFNRRKIFNGETIITPQPTTITTSMVTSFNSFLQSLPAFQSLSRATQVYLGRTNIRPMIFPNIYELNQSCFSEPWQLESYAATWKMMCGPDVYKDFQNVEKLAAECLISDPVVTRLWMVVLFFSTPLQYHNDDQVKTPLFKRKQILFNLQNAYTTLLWKYLLSRHQEMNAIRIFTNLMRIYMRMQLVGSQIYLYLRSKEELVKTHEALEKVSQINNDVDETDEELFVDA